MNDPLLIGAVLRFNTLFIYLCNRDLFQIITQTPNNCITTHKDKKEDQTSALHSQSHGSVLPPASSSLLLLLPSASVLVQSCTSHNVLVK